MLNTAAAARILEVCPATVRNWRRAGLLSSSAEQPLRFRRTEVLQLKRRLQAGRFPRLKSRANRLHRQENLPAGKGGLWAAILLEKTAAGRFSAAERLLEFGLALAVSRGEAESVEAALAGCFRRSNLIRVFSLWHRRLEQPELSGERVGRLVSVLAEADAPPSPAAAMQLLRPPGERRRNGVFFTPAEVIGDMTGNPAPGVSILDPACGVGDFLLGFLRSGRVRLDQLHGIDVDPDAADLARLNLLLHDVGTELLPDIRCADALKLGGNEKFDLIVGNPPWGGVYDAGAAGRRWPGLGEKPDSFAAFLALSLELVKPEGRISLLLPESLLTVRRHEECRRYLEARSLLSPPHRLGRVFPGVMSGAVRLDLRPKSPSVVRRSPALLKTEKALVELLDSLPHRRLAGNAEFLLGIVTGNNAGHLRKRPGPGLEPVWRGSGVAPFRLGKPAGYLAYEPERFQQVAPEWKYRAPEKLIYRFVGGKLIFARDLEGRLTLNSANALIPRLPGLSALRLAAWLNGSLANAYFRRRFRELKVLRWHLEALPIPDFLVGLPPDFDHLLEKVETGEEEPSVPDEEIVRRAAAGLRLKVPHLKNLTFSASDDIFSCF